MSINHFEVIYVSSCNHVHIVAQACKNTCAPAFLYIPYYACLQRTLWSSKGSHMLTKETYIMAPMQKATLLQATVDCYNVAYVVYDGMCCCMLIIVAEQQTSNLLVSNSCLQHATAAQVQPKLLQAVADNIVAQYPGQASNNVALYGGLEKADTNYVASRD